METKISAFGFNNTTFVQSLKTQQEIWVFNSNGAILFAIKARARGVQKIWEEPQALEMMSLLWHQVHPFIRCSTVGRVLFPWRFEQMKRKKSNWWLMWTIDCKIKPFLFGVNKNICVNIMWSGDIEVPKTFFGLSCDCLNRKHNCDIAPSFQEYLYCEFQCQSCKVGSPL